MFKFAEPTYLFLLILVPILIGIYVLSNIKKRRNIKKIGNPDLLKLLMPNVSKFRPTVKFYFQIIALIFIIIVLARPQFGSKEEIIKQTGIEVMIALDVSNSMMAEDIKPNRLEKAKQIVSQLIEKMERNQIGMIVFAGDPFVQIPITSDYVSAKMFLSSINTKMISNQGTAIGSAIDLAIRSFNPESMAERAIILITDGENHEDDAIAAAKLAAENNISVYVIGIGTPEGAPIPVSGTMSFLKDKDNNIVVTKLNEEMCRNIAHAAKGTYVLAENNSNAQRVINSEIEKLTKKEIEKTIFTEHDEQFQSFAFFALFFLIIDFFVLSRKNKRLSKIKFFELKEKIIK